MDPKSFGYHIQRLIEKKDLDEEASYQCFKDLLTNGQSELQQGAFLAALVSKGETAEELYGAWRAIYELDTVKVTTPLPDPLFENSGTGMDGLFTFNVSTASAIVASSLGVVMARHGARALTSKCGTVDILEALGINVEAEVELVAESIKETGIGLFNGMSPKVHPGALARILSQIHFGSTFNISASLASPVRPKLALRGVYREDLMEKIGMLMRRIGYERAMVVHGLVDGHQKGMDEISPCGITKILQFDSKEVKRYELTPQDLGIPTYEIKDIVFSGDLKEEIKRFLLVLGGKGSKACTDFTAINSGAILYVADKAESILKGKEMAMEAISSGKALQKLVEWVGIQRDPAKEGPKRLLSLLSSLRLLS